MARSGGQFFVEIGREMSTLAQENVAIHERPVSDVFHQRRSKKWGAVTFSFATGAFFCAWRKGRRSKLRPGRPAIFCVRGANIHHPDAQVRRLPATQTKQPQQERWQPESKTTTATAKGTRGPKQQREKEKGGPPTPPLPQLPQKKNLRRGTSLQKGVGGHFPTVFFVQHSTGFFEQPRGWAQSGIGRVQP